MRTTHPIDKRLVESSRRGNLGYLFHESKHEIKVLFGTDVVRESLALAVRHCSFVNVEADGFCTACASPFLLEDAFF
jgi:hypothetical protein